MTSYMIGSPDVIQLNISVSNQGEDAFDASVKTGLPNGVSYLNRRIIEAVSIQLIHLNTMIKNG